MQPVNDETLVLFYYGELDAREADAVREQLAVNAELAKQFAELSAELGALPDPAMPERDDFYGRRVWARVDAALEANGEKNGTFLAWPGFRWMGGLLVMAMVAVIAFQLGRHAPMPDSEILAGDSVLQGQPSAGGRQARLLQASLVNHFGDAERLLTEVANSETGEVDLDAEKDWANVLLVANRLYRFAAEQAGQHRIALLLADMEPVLIELANGAGQLTPDEYRLLRRSISERDLLFKVRSTNLVLESSSKETGASL